MRLRSVISGGVWSDYNISEFLCAIFDRMLCCCGDRSCGTTDRRRRCLRYACRGPRCAASDPPAMPCQHLAGHARIDLVQKAGKYGGGCSTPTGPPAGSASADDRYIAPCTCATISNERLRFSWSKMLAVTISSSAPVLRTNSSRPRRTVSGPPTTARPSASSRMARA
jgi:hypothetical protein